MHTPLCCFATLFTLLLIPPFAKAEEVREHFPEKIVITVVDEAGKPITHANGFHDFRRYVRFTVDEHGVFEIPIAEYKERWQTATPPSDVTIRAEGYGPFLASFRRDPIPPDTFTVVLKPAQKIGTLVVEDKGNPVEGVGVSLLVTPETAYKTRVWTGIQTKTNADGKWSIFELPATSSQVHISFEKEEYQPTSVTLPTARLNPDAAGQYNEKIVLEADLSRNNPIFLSSLEFLENPVPVADSKASAEAEMKPYTETIPGTEVTFKMVPIKGGKFLMGSPENEQGRKADEGPRHEVEIKPFWMEEHETTRLEFEQFALYYLRRNRKDMAPPTARERVADAFVAPTNPWGTSEIYVNRGKPGYPATSMTIYAAQAYCKWLTIMTGRYYRLPTEAEWEYACRAGSESAYSFGNDAGKINDVAWYFGNSDGQVQKVKQKQPNAWGLYDMHGNVAEWVLEQYAADTYENRKPEMFGAPVKALIVRVGVNVTAGHIVRGGHFEDELSELRSARRLYSGAQWNETEPGYPHSIWWLTDAPFVGFRIVRPLEPPKTEEEAKLYEPDPEVWHKYYMINGR